MFYHILEVKLVDGTKLTCFKSQAQDKHWSGATGEGYYYQLMHEVMGLDCQFYPFNVFNNELNWTYETGLADAYIKNHNFDVKLINRDYIISIGCTDYFEIEDGQYY